MKYDIIKTHNYLLIVDDSEININQYVYCDLGYIEKVMDIINGWVYHTNTLGKNPIKHYKKIIAHLPLNDSPILDGVDLLPPLEDYDKLNILDFDYIYSEFLIFEKGYNKAKEKYKYTEDDMRKAFRSGAFTGAYTGNNSGVHIEKDENNFIQFLQQPKYPVAFECEIEKPSDSFGSWVGTFINGSTKTKTTTNSNGQTEWVGQYIY